MNLESQPKTPSRLIDPSAEQVRVIEALRPVYGPVSGFVPREGNKALQEHISSTGEVPEGFFEDCALFDDHNSLAQEQRRLRRITPLAKNVVMVVEENLDGSDSDYVAWRLMALGVEQTYSQAAMVEAAKQHQNAKQAGSLSEKNSRFLKEQLNGAQDKVYAQLDPEIANLALRKVTNQELAMEKVLSEDARHAWHELLHKNYDPIFEAVYAEHPLDSGEIVGEQLRAMTETYMCASGLPMAEGEDDDTAWKCVYDERVSGFQVKSGRKKIECGMRDKPLDRMGFEKLMMHEVIIHAWRAENGSRTGYAAFQTGLPGYEESEEGLGLLMESLWAGEEPDKLSRDDFRYVALSYASGTYDDILHSEQETYDYMRELMQNAGYGQDTAELYRHVMRPFRGMPDGCRMRSNATYLAGKIEMMRNLENSYRASEDVQTTFQHLQAGKINSASDEQAELLKAAQEARLHTTLGV